MILRISVALAGVLTLYYAFDPIAAKDFILRLVSRFDPRYCHAYVVLALWLSVGWSALDFVLRFAARKKVYGSGPKYARIWNACGAGVFFAAALALGFAFDWKYDSLTRSFFQSSDYRAPSPLDYLQGRPVFESGPDDSHYAALGLAVLALLLYGAIKGAVRLVRRARRSTTPTEERSGERREGATRKALQSVFDSPWKAFLFYLVSFDVLSCVVSFLNWAAYRLYFAPLSKWTSVHEFSPEGVWGAVGALLAIVNLLEAAALARKEDK